jgi:hypothetical protein
MRAILRSSFGLALALLDAVANASAQAPRAEREHPAGHDLG